MELERKSFPFELKEEGLDSDERTFEGFAAVMGNLDDWEDIIVNGAFKKTIKEMRKPDGSSRIKVFWIHNFQVPIGRVLDLKEVPKSKLPKEVIERAPDATGGLWVKGHISPIPDGDAALTLMKDAVLDELSIGFRSVKEEWDDDEEIRYLKEVKLMDISPVPLAANVAAIVTDVKKYGRGLPELAEKVRVEVGLDKSEAFDSFVEALAAQLTGKEDKAEDAEVDDPEPDTETQKQIVDALIQGAEIQRTAIEALGE